MANVKAGKAFVLIEAVDKTGTVLRGIEGKLNKFAGSLENIGGGFLAAGLAGLAPLGGAVKMFADFESVMSDLGKTSGASESQLKGVSKQLMDISKATGIGPTELAKGLQDLVAQGMDFSQAVASMEAVGKVSAATGSEITDVTKTAFQLQSALGIKPDELVSTFDALAQAGKSGAFELKDIAAHLPSVATSAAALGIQGKKGAVSLAAMLQVVRKGAPDASTAANNLLNLLQKITSPDAVKNFKKFGINIEDVIKKAQAEGRNPVEAALDEIQKATGGDPFKVGQIFGDMQVKNALMPLLKFRDEYEAIKAKSGGASGIIDEDAAKSAKTLHGQWKALLATFERLAITVGEALAPAITSLLTTVLAYVQAAVEWADANRGLIVTVGGVFLGLTVIGGALLAAAVAIKVVAFAFGLLGTLASAAAAIMAFMVSPFMIVVLAIGVVLAALYKFNGAFREIVNGLGSFLGEAFSGIGATFAKTFQGIFAALEAGDLNAAWEIAAEGLSTVWLQVIDVMMDAWDGFVTFILQAWHGVAGMVEQAMLSMQKNLATQILDLAAEDGILGDLLDTILGVDVSAEKKRGIELEKQRIEGMKARGIDAEPQADAFQQARDDMRKEFDKKMEDAGDARGQALNNRAKAVEEANAERQKKIEERRKKLDELVAKAETKRDEMKTTEELKEDTGEEQDKLKALLDGLGGAESGLAPSINQGLEKGSVEAAKTAWENMVRGQGEGGKDPVKVAEDQLEVLRRIDKNLENNNMAVV